MTPLPLRVWRSFRPSARLAPLAMAAAVALAPVALGQPTEGKKGEPLKPPTAQAGSNTAGPWLPMLIGVGVAALVVGVSFIPSKRGHQD